MHIQNQRSTSTATQIGRVSIFGSTAMWFKDIMNFGGEHRLFLKDMRAWIGLAQDMGYKLPDRFNSVRDSSSYTTVSLTH